MPAHRGQATLGTPPENGTNSNGFQGRALDPIPPMNDPRSSGPADVRAARERWETLWLPFAQIERDMEGCLRQIGAALINLGGSTLNEAERK